MTDGHPGRHRSSAIASAAPQASKDGAPGDRRGKILEVATRQFAEYGYEATTVRRIAEEVKILSGSLYHYFLTKEAMLDQIVRAPVQQMRDNVLRISQAPFDAERRLIALIVLELRELTGNQAVHAILFNERHFFRRRPEFEYVVHAKKDAFSAWMKVLADGRDAGLFKPDVEIFLTSSTIIRMLNTAADGFHNDHAPAFMDNGAYDLDQYIDFLLNFIVGSVRSPSRSSEPIPRAACEELARFIA